MNKRRFQILECLSRGLSNKEIARELGISDLTVKNHVYKVVHSYGVHDRVSALMCALARGDLDVNKALAYWRAG